MQQLAFDLELRNRFGALSDEYKDTQQPYDQILECVREAAESVIGKPVKERSKHWVSEATKKLVEERDNARINLEMHVCNQQRQISTRSRSKVNSIVKNKLNNEWKRLSLECQQAHKRDHVDHLKRQLKLMQDAAEKRQPKRQWQLISQLAGKERKVTEKVRSNKLPGTATEKDVMNEWRTYFNELLNVKTTSNKQTIEPLLTSRAAERIQPETVTNSIPTGPFTPEEFKKAIESLKKNKAPGPDDIMVNELLKNGGNYLHSVLRTICSSILSGSDPPWQWTTGNIVPVPKKKAIYL